MKKFMFGLCALVMIFGCSSLTRNIIQPGKFVFDGGVYKDKKWDDQFVMKRTTWYTGLTTVFDIAIAKVDVESPFFQWFDKTDRMNIKLSKGPCFVGLYYSGDEKRIPMGVVRSQIRDRGGNIKQFNSFFENLRAHPKSYEYSYSMYKEIGFCFDGPVKNVPITIPGFPEVNF